MGLREREKRGRSFRDMGPRGKGGEMSSEASGVEQLEHLMIRGMGVTKGNIQCVICLCLWRCQNINFLISQCSCEPYYKALSKLPKGFLFPKLTCYINSFH